MTLESQATDKAFRVCIRLRPTTDALETEVTKNVVLKVTDPTGERASEFLFDRVLNDQASQEDTFDAVARPLVSKVLDGYNACAFAYGQTGSGKTFSMFGPDDAKRTGIVQRATQALFAGLSTRNMTGIKKDTVITCAMVEIYQDRIHDLIDLGKKAALKSARTPRTPASSRASTGGDEHEGATSLEVVDSNGETVIMDLTHHEVTTAAEVMELIRLGQSVRRVASTAMNDVSSRSHTVFKLTLRQVADDGSQDVQSTLNIVDLAGSERVSKSKAEGRQLKEARSINMSLTALGKVILARVKGDAHPPYRDSKLTRVLKGSLQGNSYTSLLACVNMHSDHYEECINTLQFAVRCSNVDMAPRINYVGAEGGGGGAVDAQAQELIKKLTTEVLDLRRELEGVHTHYQKELEMIAGGGAAFARDLGPVERPQSRQSRGMPAASAARESDSSRPPSSLLVAKPRGMTPDQAAILEGELGRSQKLLQDAVSQRNYLKERMLETEHELEKKREAVNSLQMRLQQQTSQSAAERREDRNKSSELAKALESTIHGLQRQLEERDKEHMTSMARKEAAIAEVRKQLREFTHAIPPTLAKRMNQKFDESALEDRLRKKVAAQHKAELAELEGQKAAIARNLKEQSQYFLRKKSEQLALAHGELGSIRGASAKEAEELRAEVEHLYEYARRVTTVVEKLESGMYTLKEKSGLKGFTIPAKDKPRPLDMSVCKYIQMKMEQADRIVAEPRGRPASGSSRGDGWAERSTAGSLGFSTPVRGAGSMRPFSAVSQGTEEMTTEELRGEVEGLRQLVAEASIESKAKLSQAERQEVEEQVLEELSANSTVEYIRRLEADKSSLQLKLKQEIKRAQDLRVALNSANRLQHERHAPRKDSPLMMLHTPGPGAGQEGGGALRPRPMSGMGSVGRPRGHTPGSAPRARAASARMAIAGRAS